MTLRWLQKYNLLAFDTIDSTNSEGKRLAKTGGSGSTVIWTKNQTAARGRYGRHWESKEGNLHMSILMSISCELMEAAQLSFVMGLAVHEVIESLAKKYNVKVPIYLKWPNDIFIKDRKIGGILLESLISNNKQWIIIGLGLNIEHVPGREGASSLEEHGIKTTSSDILNMIVDAFDYYKELWHIQGFSHIRALWLTNAYKLGQMVTINNMGSDPVAGIFESIDNTGAIEIRLASGEVKTMSTGETFFGIAKSP